MASRLQFSLIFSCLLVCGVLADYPGFKTRETIAPLGHHRLAFSSLKRSAQHRQVQHDATRAIKDPKRETLINLLWNQNRDLVDQFLNVDFLKFQAEHPQNETLPSYQYYSVQDYYYLVDYVEYKALRMSTIPEFNSTHLLSDINAEADSIKSDTEYSWKFRNTTLVVDLAIPWSAIDNGKRSVQEIAYADWLQKNLDLGWFTLHVMSIPCIYGWTQLAAKLNSSDATLKDTIFYKTWIKPNNDPSYADSLSAFLEENRDAYYSANANATWTAVFRQALQFEINLFNSALGKNLTSLS